MAERSVAFEAWTAPVAVGLSFGAAAVHFSIIGEHFAEFPPFGLLFAGLAWFQLGWAAAYLLRPAQSLALLAIAINVGTVAIWLASRTTGLPFGPDPGDIEPVGALDLLATAFELALVGVLGLRLTSASSLLGASLSPSRATAVLGASTLMIVILSSAALAADTGHAGTDHEHTDSDSAHHQSPNPDASPSEASPALPAGAATSPARASPTTAAQTIASPATAVPAAPGTITFGARFDLAGEVQAPSSTFKLDATAVWVAQLSDSPGTSLLRVLILEARPDGRLTEHWNQEIAVAGPAARRMVGMANLSLYAHGGPATYVLRYVRGDDTLAEGQFTLVP